MWLIIIGLFISYIFSCLILPDKEGIKPKINPTFYPIMNNGMIILPYNNKKAFHLHHWVLYLFICIISIFVKIPRIIVGFSLGLFIQGLLYKDRFNFICDNPYNN
jgi:hypothetical protein